MSTNPSQMMKLNKGRLEVGMDADFAIVDLNREVTFFEDQFESKSVNTPFIDFTVWGKVVSTVRKGIFFNWN